ncbi:MAG: ribonuclease H-like YkuK family protein [Bacillaceae bacterium]
MGDTYQFYNLSMKKMTIEDVYNALYRFVLQDPTSMYRFSIGTDSQVYRKSTKFITAVHLHRIGKGAWGCLCEHVQPRKIHSLREKILLETLYSREIAMIFNDEKLRPINQLLVALNGNLLTEFHLDVGKGGLTRELIQEVTEIVHQTGMKPIIKPESYAAFSYANRYTK